MPQPLGTTVGFVNRNSWKQTLYIAYLERVRQPLFDRKRENVYSPALELRNRRESCLEDRIQIPL